MSNSALVNHVHLSPNYTAMSNKKNEVIVIHHMAGKLTVEQCGNVFAPASRKASSNYGVDGNGRIGLYVEEKNRSWATSSRAIDSRAITIEVANSVAGGNWPVSDKAMTSLINLCVDVCKRNGIKKLNYTGDKSGNLQMHRWYADKNVNSAKYVQDSNDGVNIAISYRDPDVKTASYFPVFVTAKKIGTISGSNLRNAIGAAEKNHRHDSG